MSASTPTRAAVDYLVPPDTVIEAGREGTPLDLGARAGKPLLIVLHITEIVEQESLHVSIWGSADGINWGSRALFWFPQKFYRGATPAALDLTQRPEVKWLQARWEVNRWGRCSPRPYFKVRVEAQPLDSISAA